MRKRADLIVKVPPVPGGWMDLDTLMSLKVDIKDTRIDRKLGQIPLKDLINKSR